MTYVLTWMRWIEGDTKNTNEICMARKYQMTRYRYEKLTVAILALLCYSEKFGKLWRTSESQTH